MIIMGLDPGTARVGWGVIEETNKQIKLIMETNTKTKNEIMSREGTRTNNG